MLSPEGEHQCNRCRKLLEGISSEIARDQFTFCSYECKAEYRMVSIIEHRAHAETERHNTARIVKAKDAEPDTPPQRRRVMRNDTDEFRREDVQPARWKTALWVTLAMCVAFKLATVYLQWQRGEAVTFGGQIVIKGR